MQRIMGTICDKHEESRQEVDEMFVGRSVADGENALEASSCIRKGPCIIKETNVMYTTIMHPVKGQVHQTGRQRMENRYEETSSAMRALQCIRASNRYVEEVQRTFADIGPIANYQSVSKFHVQQCQDDVNKEVTGA